MASTHNGLHVDEHLTLANPWASKFTPRNIERMAEQAWETLTPDQQSSCDYSSWASGFRASMAIMSPVIQDVCEHNQKMSDTLIRSASLSTSAVWASSDTLSVKV